jgi:uncharacterized membrane protein YkgB
MTRPRKRKFNPKTINIKAMEISMWKFIRNDPLMSAMYKDELLARDLEEERRDRRINRRPKKTPGRLC